MVLLLALWVLDEEVQFYNYGLFTVAADCDFNLGVLGYKSVHSKLEIKSTRLIHSPFTKMGIGDLTQFVSMILQGFIT